MVLPRQAAALLRAVAAVLVLCALGAPGAAQAADGPVVRFSTSMGAVEVELLPESAPRTVENFLSYVRSGAYDGSVIHRSVKDFVVQGGGYRPDGDGLAPIPAEAAVVNEPGVSNLRGTLAMAKLDGNPNSATNQWFFNVKDNAANLDAANGGFTVFGRVVGAAGLGVVDAIGALQRTTFSGMTDFPVRGWTTGAPVLRSNLLLTDSITVLPPVGAPAAPGAPPAVSPAPGAAPERLLAAPRPRAWRLLSRAIAAPTLSRRAGRLRLTVHDLPPGTRLRATLTGAGPTVSIRATAPRSGRAALTFALTRTGRSALRRSPRGALLVTVVATPPGGRATRATALVALRR